jgi:DNA-binding CsgD family transcriptional regulator
VKVPNSAPPPANRLDDIEILARPTGGQPNGGSLRALILDEGEQFGPIIDALLHRGIKVVGVARGAEQTFSALSRGLTDIVVRCVWAREMVPVAHDGKAPIDEVALHRYPQALRTGDPLAGLTPRERQILGLLVQGASNKDMAKRLAIRSNTVRTHVQNVLSKLCVHTRLGAATLAMRHGSFANDGVEDA